MSTPFCETIKYCRFYIFGFLDLCDPWGRASVQPYGVGVDDVQGGDVDHCEVGHLCVKYF